MSIPVNPAKRLIPPPGGCTVRMYRTGHGDCFLLAFAGEKPDQPVYVLIDCGYKPGSPTFISTTPKEIGKSIEAATGGHVHVAVITHEHQDHVNGITKNNFPMLTIDEMWLAWTENPEDEVANRLRVLFKDKLLGLIAARNQLAAAGSDPDDRKRVGWIDDLLEFELGGDEDETFNLMAAEQLLRADGDPANSKNKQSMKLFKDRAKMGCRFLKPHEEVIRIPGAANARAYVLGPPRDEKLLTSLDPEGDEVFHQFGLAAASPGNFFAAAAHQQSGRDTAGGGSPFARRFAVPLADAAADLDYGHFFLQHYGVGDDAPPLAMEASAYPESNVPDNAEWRRIDRDWLYSAEQLALDMSNYTNNSSLVLAFELGKGGKVLLFAADAQRGNWISWAGADWTDGTERVSTRDLLARTILYKVGHHGSHNATLNGPRDSDTPNLAWMAHGQYAREFTAMITAVRAWAETQKGWDHPLKSIKEALLAKASGRVFQTDTVLSKMVKPDNTSKADWDQFQSRCDDQHIYVDYSITAD